MGHPILFAAGAAGALALLFGSKTAHALPANNGGGLQPAPLPPGNLLGPTAAPAPSSGLPAPTYTGSDGKTYAGDGNGGVIFPTGNGVSVPAYNAPPAPSQDANMGTFSDSDDNSPTATADSGAAGYDPNFLLSPGNPIDASSGDTSVSGPIDDYASAVAGPYDSYTAAVVAGLSHHHGLQHFSAATQRVGDGVTLGETSGLTEAQDVALQNAAAVLARAKTLYQNALMTSQRGAAPTAIIAKASRHLAWAKHHYAQVLASVSDNEGPTYGAVLQPGGPTIGAPLPYRKGRKNPTASNHLPPKRGAQKARVGAPSGLVHDAHGNWTHSYPGHRWGAPPPAGQPIF